MSDVGKDVTASSDEDKEDFGKEQFGGGRCTCTSLPQVQTLLATDTTGHLFN